MEIAAVRSLLDAVDDPGYRLVVLDGDREGPLEGLLAETFETQSISVDAGPGEGGNGEFDDPVVLLDGETAIATSSMTECYEALLGINSDLFVTGARDLEEAVLPAVFENLTEHRFTLRGYPLAHKEKLLLILVSRHVERLALEAGSGAHYAAFQRLSRLDDERGTRRVYKRLGETDLDVRLFGVGDGDDVPATVEASVTSGSTPFFRRSWFVVFRSETAPGRSGALVCLETEPRTWDGFFTFEDDRVATIETALFDG